MWGGLKLGLRGGQTSPSKRKSTLNIHWKDWCWSSILWPPDVKSWGTGKDPSAGKDWGQEEKGTREGEMVGWHHRLNGHESEKSRRQWRTGKPGVLQSMGSQRVGHEWATEQQRVNRGETWPSHLRHLQCVSVRQPSASFAAETCPVWWVLPNRAF